MVENGTPQLYSKVSLNLGVLGFSKRKQRFKFNVQSLAFLYCFVIKVQQLHKGG